MTHYLQHYSQPIPVSLKGLVSLPTWCQEHVSDQRAYHVLTSVPRLPHHHPHHHHRRDNNNDSSGCGRGRHPSRCGLLSAPRSARAFATRNRDAARSATLASARRFPRDIYGQLPGPRCSNFPPLRLLQFQDHSRRTGSKDTGLTGRSRVLGATLTVHPPTGRTLAQTLATLK